MEKTLTIRDLRISFQASGGTVRAVRGVDLDLYQGETLAIVGESGSGKSVTVKAIMGIVSSNQIVEGGTILYRCREKDEWTERDLLRLSRREMRRHINGTHIAMVFQDPMTSLDPTMTIGMQLMEGMIQHLHLSRALARRRAIELLELVGIPEAEKRMRNYPHQLSGGMRQRVVIAIALSCSPDILICDEPTTALDVTIQAKILELIQEIQRKTGISVIYITHDLGVVAKVADYVAVMYAGRIAEKGTVEDIFYDPRHPYTWGGVCSAACRTSPMKAARGFTRSPARRRAWLTCLRAILSPRATPMRWKRILRRSRRCFKSARRILRQAGCWTSARPRWRCPTRCAVASKA